MPPRKNKKTIRRSRRRCSRGGENSSQKKTINPHRPPQPKPSKLSFLGTRRTKRPSSINQTRKRSPRDGKSPREDVLTNIRVLRDKLQNISIHEKTYTELREYKKEIEELMGKCHTKYGVSEHVKDSFCNVLIPYLQNINNKLEFHNL